MKRSSIVETVVGVLVVVVAVLAWHASKLPTTVTIPVPVASPEADPPPVEASIIETPIRIDLKSIESQVNNSLPRTFGENGSGEFIQYGIYPHHDAAVRANGDSVHLKVNFEFKAGHPPFFSCGFDHAIPAHIEVDGALTLKPEWRVELLPATSIGIDGQCTITAAQFNVTGLVRDKANAAAPGINEQLKDRFNSLGDLRTRVATAWAAIDKPIEIKPHVWLVLNPQSAVASQPSGDGTSIGFSAGLVATPQLVISDSAPQNIQTSLPLLTFGDPGKRFHIALDGTLSYASATKFLKTKLVRQSYEFEVPGPIHAKRKITVTDAVMLSVGDNAVLKLSTTGDLVADLYFWGHPAYQNAGIESITVPELDFTLETRNALAKGADWLLHGDLVSELRKNAVLPLDVRVQELRASLDSGLVREIAPGVQLTGKVDDVALRGVYLTGSRIVVRAVADGTTSLALAVQ